jgi:rSAM/selenodomain-associated transferase 1
MPDKAIVFLTKEPIAGKVKTRLAKDIGEKNAKDLHELLVFHCLKIALSCNIPVFVSLKGHLQSLFAQRIKDIGCQLLPQVSGDLGQKMHDVFSLAQRVVILGTDTPNIQREELLTALESTEIMIGPAKDGGYWLIAGNTPPKGLFENIPWSTDKVLQKTQTQLEYLSLSCQYLTMRQDIDYLTDLNAFISNPSPYPSLQKKLRCYARNTRLP